MRFLWLRRNEGSVTPLILGFAIVLVAVIATLSDLTYFRNAHLALKSEGQEVLAQSMRHLSAEDYYNGRSASRTSFLLLLCCPNPKKLFFVLHVNQKLVAGEFRLVACRVPWSQSAHLQNDRFLED